MSTDRIAREETGSGSVSRWMDQLRQFGANDEIQQELWNRYFRRLAALARGHLSRNVCRVVDEEDVALSVLNSFFVKLDQGRFPQLNNRNQLWSLLSTIAMHKAIKARAKQNAQKRGHGKVRGESAFSEKNGLQELIADEPGPSELAEFNNLVKELLAQLDPTLGRIAYQKMLGKTDVEIADESGVSPRTVARKLSRIRSIWSGQLDDGN